jgi:hypothetical protein
MANATDIPAGISARPKPFSKPNLPLRARQFRALHRVLGRLQQKVIGRQLSGRPVNLSCFERAHESRPTIAKLAGLDQLFADAPEALGNSSWTTSAPLSLAICGALTKLLFHAVYANGTAPLQLLERASKRFRAVGIAGVTVAPCQIFIRRAA